MHPSWIISDKLLVISEMTSLFSTKGLGYSIIGAKQWLCWNLFPLWRKVTDSCLNHSQPKTKSPKKVNVCCAINLCSSSLFSELQNELLTFPAKQSRNIPECQVRCHSFRHDQLLSAWTPNISQHVCTILTACLHSKGRNRAPRSKRFEEVRPLQPFIHSSHDLMNPLPVHYLKQKFCGGVFFPGAREIWKLLRTINLSFENIGIQVPGFQKLPGLQVLGFRCLYFAAESMRFCTSRLWNCSAEPGKW